ncbi:2-polyprenylphenol 6-hydroxylase [Chthonobacter rhizosphaerae]|uniref:2-polyprenylphenol 6-hydroxylase n=1 Tax=Chthonobacter rhizosphaerae TaxID=2735553 RepID=UPI0015EEA2D2|nr:2-polyprenylphenol 6-hydroxylase [Chthonobacter rhizosphaerae]
MALGDLFRLARGAFVLAREGVATAFPLPEPIPMPIRLLLGLARLIQRPAAGDRDGAERITRAVNRLGPSYVKLGQFLATRPDVVGRRMAADLSALQDNVPAFGETVARAEVMAAFGVPVETAYATFGPPIAAASIAQVHRAEVDDPITGERRTVAVKVLRPGVARRFARDLNSFYIAARAIERLHPPSRRLKPRAIVDTLARSVALEMDFRLEAAALSEMAENTAADPGFRVPAVIWERTSKSVLTMEWIDGLKLSKVDRLVEEGHDTVALAATLIQSFLRHAMRDGFFHADMHQGNLFVDRDGALVAVDFGIMGRLGAKERRFLAEILYGFIRRNYRRVAEVHFEAGYVPAHHDVDTFAQALRAIGEPLQGHTAADISMARLLTQLFEVTELFDMQTRPELIMLQKTMVVVEGVARTLDPQLDMWRTAEPVVSEWIARNLGPVGRIEEAAGTIGSLVRLAGQLPTLARDLEAAAAADRDRNLFLERQRWSLERLVWPAWIAALALAGLAVSSLF